MDWKDEFLRLYLSGEVEDHRQALELKEKNLPQKLYRFRPGNNMNFVRDELLGLIYIPFIGGLNDPFDSSSLMLSSSLSDYFDSIAYKKAFEKIWGKELPEEVFSKESWLEQLVEHFLKMTDCSDGEKKATREAIRSTAEKQLIELNQYFNYTLQTALRVASFSEKLTNLPMWSHYANEHKGICFEYDISKIVDPYIKNRLFPVKYAPSLPNAIALMEERMAEHKQPSFTLYDYFAMSKLDDWAYEKEWRLIINLGLEMVKQEDAEGKLAGQGMLHWFEKPSKIYFGAKIPEAQKATIKELCKNHNIEMRQMKCTEYGLKDFPME
ncbi:MAG: DUF2971 domain-containing protein [Faecalibacterium prausnitzii]|nr:DUF2971 domain-containing protein [Faecalibacterium prausnitzii]